MAPATLPTSPFVKRARQTRGASASIRKSLVIFACLGGVVLVLAAMQLFAFRRMSSSSTSLSSPSLAVPMGRSSSDTKANGISLVHHHSIRGVDGEADLRNGDGDEGRRTHAASSPGGGGIRWSSRETTSPATAKPSPPLPRGMFSQVHSANIEALSGTNSSDRSAAGDRRPANPDAPLLPHGASAIPYADRWPAIEVYYPVTVTVRKTFQVHEYKQQQKLNSQLPGNVQWTEDIREVCEAKTPECLFFELTKTPFLFKKCCVEHLKLRRTLFDVADLAERAGLQIFLMFGTLLSSMRDGGLSLLPWETDIDLGILGADPFTFQRQMDAALAAAAESLGQKPKEQVDHATGFLRDDPLPHHMVSCRTDGNDADPKRIGTCSDVHSVYYAADSEGSAADATRVELWPYHRVLTNRAAFTVHNTRQVGQKHVALLELFHPYLENGGGEGPQGDKRTAEQFFVWETVRRSELLLPERLVTPLVKSVPIDDAAPASSTEEPQQQSPMPTAAATKPCRLWGRQFLCPADSLRFLDLEYHGRDGWMKPKTIHWGNANVAPWK